MFCGLSRCFCIVEQKVLIHPGFSHIVSCACRYPFSPRSLNFSISFLCFSIISFSVSKIMSFLWFNTSHLRNAETVLPSALAHSFTHFICSSLSLNNMVCVFLFFFFIFYALSRIQVTCMNFLIPRRQILSFALWQVLRLLARQVP